MFSVALTVPSCASTALSQSLCKVFLVLGARAVVGQWLPSCRMWEFQDQDHTCLLTEVQSPDPWTTREVPVIKFKLGQCESSKFVL